MAKRIQLAAVWAGPGLFRPISRRVRGLPGSYRRWPVVGPGQGHAGHYDHAISIRIGMVLGLIATTLLFPFFGVISIQIARIEKGMPLLAVMQFGGAVLLVVFFSFAECYGSRRLFAPSLSPSTIRMLDDLSWLTFVMVFPLRAATVLRCDGVVHGPLYSTVVATLGGLPELWIALSGAGGGLAVFFKHGPFAWNGLIGFYIPIGAFTVWIAVMTYYMHSASVGSLTTVRRLLRHKTTRKIGSRSAHGADRSRPVNHILRVPPAQIEIRSLPLTINTTGERHAY